VSSGAQTHLGAAQTQFGSFSMHVFVLTLQNFINKHTANVENVEGKKKNEKDQFTRRETNTN
jgi:hypothetical protein